MSFLKYYCFSNTYAHDYTKRGFTHLYCKPCSLVRCPPARQASPACYKEKKKASITRWKCLHGSWVFIDDICSRLKGHRRYKYIWKSLFTVEGAFSSMTTDVQGVCPLLPHTCSRLTLQLSTHAKWQPSTEIYQGEIYVFRSQLSLLSSRAHCGQCFSSCTFLLV